ncbi:helix-turn-helix domain-containing protein [Sandarakinorhabdus sp.]|uniref:helix-turn-helix domain-containing protein n=1 Tax=Sandarakinorhabdus sp. TaxID=1916663 RepID=UPI003F6F1799
MSDSDKIISISPVGAADTVPTQDGPASPLSVGALLAETRAATGKDLADIARETRVPLRHLMAIEADDHGRLPALPYAIGFVKSYARAVGLDAENVTAQFRAETSIMPHVPTALNTEPLAEARLPSPGLAWGSVALLVVLIGALGAYGAGMFDPAPTAETESQLAEAPPVASPTDPAASPATDPTASPPPAAVADPGEQPDISAPAAPAVAVPGARIPSTGPVVLVAQEDVWVKIYDRATGRRAFMGVLSAGQRFEVPADGPPLTLRAGRAGVVQVQVAGVVLPPLGGSVATIDNVVLTAPALAERFAPAPPQQPPVQQSASPAAAQAATVARRSPAPAPAAQDAPIGD